MPTYLVTERTECEACGGTGFGEAYTPNTFVRTSGLWKKCAVCDGNPITERPVDLLDVLKRLRFQMEGDTDGNSHWGFVTEVMDVDSERVGY